MAEREDFPPDEALSVLRSQEAQVRSALDPGMASILFAWGLAWLAGFGAIWLQVRGQRPYTGPDGLPAALFGVLLAGAGAVTGWRINRATAGIGGESAWAGMVYGFGWLGGFLAFFGTMGALARAGASPEGLGVLGICGPLLVVGLMYLSGATSLNFRPMAPLGGWLLLLAATIGFAGPVAATGLASVLGGGAFLLAAGWVARLGGRHGD